MAEPLEVSARVVIPDGELRWRFSRSSGPGGQSVNTSDSRVELSFDVARTPSLGPTLRARALAELAAAEIQPDYVELVSTDTLAPVSHIEGDVLAVLAAPVGRARLIDNQLIQPSLTHDNGVATSPQAPTTA